MKHLKKDVVRLGATYLAIIMVMSLVFSGIFYATAVHELERRPPRAEMMLGGGAGNENGLREYLDQRSSESRGVLLADLIGVNILVLIAGAFLSYALAERTLKPIEDNMEAQMQFVSDASHELRTPLTALRTANEVALRSKKLTSEQAREVIEENVQDIVRLQSLTDSMLGLLRDEPSVHQPVALQEVIVGAMTNVASQAHEKSITIDDQTKSLHVQGDADSLLRLMVILLDNAIKYSDRDTTITIAAGRSGKYAVVSIRDEGIGMDDDTTRHIFTRFYRADKARGVAQAHGYGLGLAIAKKIIEAHHGDIEVTSKLQQGTTFRIRLPLS